MKQYPVNSGGGMNALLTGFGAGGATALEVAEAVLVLLVVVQFGHRRAALFAAGTTALAVVVAALIAGPRVIELVPIHGLRIVVGAGLIGIGLFWLLGAWIKPEGSSDELAHETDRARRWAVRGPAASALVAVKAVAVEGAEAVVLVVAIGAPAHEIPAAATGGLVAAALVAIAGCMVSNRLTDIAGHTLNRLAGSVLLLVGCYWLAEGAQLGEQIVVPMFSVAVVLIAFCWRFRNEVEKRSL
jgi:uncharacterized membrane protein